MSDYIVLDTMWYQRDQLQKLLHEIPKFNWYEFACNNIRWTVKEHVKRYRSECKNFSLDGFYIELIDFFAIELNFDRILFSRTPPPGVPRHIDRTRNTIVNIPIEGLFYNSPQSFWTGFTDNDFSSQFHYSISEKTNEYAPVAFDGQTIHSVENEGDDDRTILSIWFDIPYSEFNRLLSEDKVFNKNYKGKYFKLVK